MYSSRTARSTRHCPRPPTWMAGSSPERTMARDCDTETFRISATSTSVRKRCATMGEIPSMRSLVVPSPLLRSCISRAVPSGKSLVAIARRSGGRTADGRGQARCWAPKMEADRQISIPRTT